MVKFCIKVAALLAVIQTVSSSPILEEPLEAGCSVTSYSEVANAVAKCKNIVINGITVPAGKTLQLDLKTGTTLTFKGTIKFGVAQWVGPLVEVKGTKVVVNGEGAVFDGQGAKFWDGKGDGGVKKPKFFRIRTKQSQFNHIKLLNCPHQCVCINSASDTRLNGWIVDVSAGDSAGGKNTDGFDLSNSNNITIANAVVKNQDDCVAVNQGFNYMFKNLTCSGGHGLSLSVGQSPESGSANTVKNVTFIDCTVTKSRNGIHIKTHSNAGNGSISSVIYKNIKMSQITHYGINVQEDYTKGGSTGKPKGNIPISGLTMQGVTGSMSGAPTSIPVYIFCGSGGCSGWKWSGISIVKEKKPCSCNYVPSGYKC